MRSLPARRRLRASPSLLDLHEVLVAIVAQVSAHGSRDPPDVASAGLAQRIAVLFPPSFASPADVGLVLEVPQALAHAGALPGGRLKFLGKKEEIHEAKI